MIRRAAIVVMLCVAGPGSALAQDATPGDRIRVRLVAADSRLTGTFRGLQDTLLLLAVPEPRAIPLGSIAGLERSLGRQPSVAGGIVGLLLGAGAGFALGCLANADDYGVFCGGQDDTKVILGMTLGGLFGAAAGALLFKQEKWTPLTIPASRAP